MTVDELLAALEAMIETARGEGRPMTDEEVARCADLERQIRAHEDTAGIEERQRIRTAPRPGLIPVQVDSDDAAELRALDRFIRSGGREVERRAQSEGVPSEGGYLVPSTFRNQLIECMRSFGGVASEAETISTSDGRTMEWPTVSDAPGGVPNEGVITPENTLFGPGADLVFGTNSIGAYKYTTLGASNEPLRVPVELLQDSAIAVEPIIRNHFAERIARTQAKDFAYGTGVGEPTGILTGTANLTLTTSNDLSNLANGYGKLLDIEDALDSSYLANARWVMSRAAWTQVRKIVDDVDRPLVLQNAQSGIGGKIERTLLGYPVTIDEGFPAAAAGRNFMVFGDIRKAYLIRRVKDFQLLADPYSRGKYGQVEFSGWERADATIQNRCAYVIVAGI